MVFLKKKYSSRKRTNIKSKFSSRKRTNIKTKCSSRKKTHMRGGSSRKLGAPQAAPLRKSLSLEVSKSNISSVEAAMARNQLRKAFGKQSSFKNTGTKGMEGIPPPMEFRNSLLPPAEFMKYNPPEGFRNTTTTVIPPPKAFALPA